MPPTADAGPSTSRSPPPINTPSLPTTLPTTRARAQARIDVLTYGIIVSVALSATRRATGPSAHRACLLIATVFSGAACFAAAGGRRYVRAHTPVTVLLRILFVLLHNHAVIVTERPRRISVAGPSWALWPRFWMTRTGPLIALIINLATGLPRGAPLATMLAGQGAAIVATQRATCAHLLRVVPEISYFYARIADSLQRAASIAGAAVLGGEGGGGGGGGAATTLPPLTPPALQACCTLSCCQVMCLLYLGVAGLTWVAAPALSATASTASSQRRQRRGGGRGGDLLDEVLIGGIAFAVGAVVAWWAIALAFPRSADCGAAAEAAWGALNRVFTE